uniref:Homeobox domain-containing protein n=1 Tax=Syphacia muris TaxID=451379 RepID=A0A0N5AZI9_9BILA
LTLLQVNELTFHENCLRCCLCEKNLETKCYEKNGRFYCEMHYYHDHSPFKCASCNIGISPTNFVYKLKTNLVFHLLCHNCCICGKQLLPGDQITVDQENRTVSCAGHLTEASGSATENHIVPSDDNGLSEVQLMTSTSSFQWYVDPDYSQLTQFAYDGFSYEFMDENKLLKRRGPRTTIKQDQLDVLNQIFTSTPKPSKHARAKLALETGLSMRVIQVWFQNRRSKERRLKHLCNYLRRYEQRGLVAPSIGIEHSDFSWTYAKIE